MSWATSNNNKGSSTNMFSNMSQTKKEDEEEKPQFQVTEQMLITELPNDLAQQFIDVYNLIQTTSKELSDNVVKVSSSTVESDFEHIRTDTLNCLNDSLTSLAHQIDFGKSSLNDCKKDLDISKSDFDNSSHFRGIPSPFIKRYSSRIIKRSQEISQSLASWNSRFQPSQMEQFSGLTKQNESQILNNLLCEQQQAILRCSSRVAAINNRLEKIKSILSTKLKTDISTEENEEVQQTLYAQKIRDDYRRFEADKKKKMIKIIQERDLFGNSLVQPAKTNSFSWGSGFGSSGFGTSSFGSTNK